MTAAERAAERKAANERAARLAARVAEWEGEVVKWQNFEKDYCPSCPDNNHPSANLAYVRVKGRVLETSMRMAVPLKAVLPILEVARLAASGETGDRLVGLLGLDYEVEGHKLRRIDTATTTRSGDQIMGNTIKISTGEVALFGEVIYQLQSNGLAYNVVTVDGNFLITITGH